MSISKNEPNKEPVEPGMKKQFPWKLHDMLELAEDRGDEAIVSWLPCGKAFRVHARESFENGMMRDFFNQTKYKSFQRQLNLWGFQRITDANNPNKGGYLHPLFVKNRRELCPCMTRQKIKNPVVRNETPQEVQAPSQVPTSLLGDLSSLSARRSSLSLVSNSSEESRLSQLLACGYGAISQLGGLPYAPRDVLNPSADLLMSHLALQREAEYRAMRSRATLALLADQGMREQKDLEALIALREARMASLQSGLRL